MSNATDVALAGAEARGLAIFDGPGANAFETYADEKGVSAGQFLRFSGNTGDYTAGQSQQPVEHGTQLVFDIMNAERGYVLWRDKRPTEQMYSKILGGKGLPAWSSLTHVKKEDKIAETDGWTEIVRIPVIDPSSGETYEFSLAAQEPWRPINRLVKEYGQKVRQHWDIETKQYKLPVVEIGAHSFESKKAIGKKWSPDLTIREWISVAELGAPVEEGDVEGTAVSAPATPVVAVAVVQPAAPQAPAPQAAPVAPVAQSATTQPGPAIGGYRGRRVGGR